MIHLTKSDAILCIDVQNDFLPGGQLPSHKGDLILENIFTFISNSKILVFASRDWHPENHCSFTPQGGPWPSHCVRDTWGASFPIGFPVEATRIVSKGTLQEKDAYSAFNGTNLAFDLKKADIKRVFVLGYCTEYCVESTAKDAIAAGLEVYVISDLCAPVNSDNVQSSIEKMSLCGIKFTTTAEFSSNGTPFIIQTNAPGLANYPHARKAGGFLFISGISCRNVDNTWKGVEKRQDGTVHLDISVQSRAVIENIKAILENAGGTLADLVDITVFLVDMKDYNAFNQVYNEYFTALNGPTRTCIGVKELPNPVLLVEIKAVALSR